jgi:osmotically-inducible protein OsmY
MVEPLSAIPNVNAEALSERIAHVLRRPRPSEPTVAVLVDGAKVTLRGVVKSQRERRLAEAVALVTRGVAEVENDLDVD